MGYEQVKRDDRGRWTDGGLMGGMPSPAEFDGMQQKPGPLGSQGGKWYTDASGQRYLVKPAQSRGHAMNEYAAARLYQHAGVNVDQTGIFEQDGRWFIAKKAIHKSDGSLGDQAGTKMSKDLQMQAREGYAVDALASTWDMHGLTGDNVIVADGTLHRIDVGGSLQYRAMGGDKPSFNPGETWVEPKTLRTSTQGQRMYGTMSDAEAATRMSQLKTFDVDGYDASLKSAGVDDATRVRVVSTVRDRIDNQLDGIVAELGGPKAAGGGVGRPAEWAEWGPGKKAAWTKKNGKPSFAGEGSVTTTAVTHSMAVMFKPAGPVATFSTTGGAASALLERGEMVPWEGVIVVEGKPSGDRRGIAENALSYRDFPLPLMAMFENPVGGDGHDGAQLAGRIDSIERRDDGSHFAKGFIDPTAPAGPTLINALDHQLMRGVSVDLDSVQFLDTKAEDGAFRWVTGGRISGVTATPFQAFMEATIALSIDEDPAVAELAADDMPLAASGGRNVRGVVWTPVDAVESLIASGGRSIPVDPPAEWFAMPNLKELTPLTVTADGRVFGHIAAFGTCHISFARCTDVPRSATNYAKFRTGSVITAEGTTVRTGPLIMDTVHPDLRMRASDAQAFYAHTGCAVADVVPYEDRFGIVLAGAARPTASPEQLRALRASDVSPDWRNIDGYQRECCALLAVNNSGFKLPMTLVASGGDMTIEPGGTSALYDEHGEVVAMVASAAAMGEAIEADADCAPCREEADAEAAAFAARREFVVAQLMETFDSAASRKAWLKRTKSKLGTKIDNLLLGKDPRAMSDEDIKGFMDALKGTQTSTFDEIAKRKQYLADREADFDPRDLTGHNRHEPRRRASAAADGVETMAADRDAVLARLTETFAGKETTAGAGRKRKWDESKIKRSGDGKFGGDEGISKQNARNRMKGLKAKAAAKAPRPNAPRVDTTEMAADRDAVVARLVETFTADP